MAEVASTETEVPRSYNGNFVTSLVQVWETVGFLGIYSLTLDTYLHEQQCELACDADSKNNYFASLVQIQASLAGVSKHRMGEKVHLHKCIHSNPKRPSTWTLKIHPHCFHPSWQEEAFFAALKFR